MQSLAILAMFLTNERLGETICPSPDRARRSVFVAVVINIIFGWSNIGAGVRSRWSSLVDVTVNNSLLNETATIGHLSTRPVKGRKGERGDAIAQVKLPEKDVFVYTHLKV